MSGLWLGAPINRADCVFLLPNLPCLPNQSEALEEGVSVSQLIELNGNHWRKILTIMAKLTTPNYSDWRQFRDNQLFSKVGLAFSFSQIERYKGLVFIVGKTFRDSTPIPDFADVYGESHLAYSAGSYVWTPYLDYRQFPNLLIESLRERMSEIPCYKH